MTFPLSKVLESIINSQLFVFLEDHRLINVSQYGFRRGRSTSDPLVCLTHRWAAVSESKREASFKNASISTLHAGNAPVAPLVLHGVVGGGDHLPSDHLNARLPCLFHKKMTLSIAK